MKLKCDDGKVRRFGIALCDGDYESDGTRFGGVSGREARCMECGYPFGFHDTKIIKHLFKKHVCKPEDIKKGLGLRE